MVTMIPRPRSSAAFHMDHRLRIIDACGNRAAEALRTMEDLARFRLGRHAMIATLKSMRHDLRAAVASIPGGQSLLVASRDAPGDPGLTVKTSGEGSRAGLAHVAAAAGKRAAEALRTLEEVAKTLDQAPHLWKQLEGIRYRVYDAERSLVMAMGAGRSRQWRLCVLLTGSACRHPILDVAAAALVGGADCLQLREPDMRDGDLLHLARSIRAVCDAHLAHAGVRADLIINNRVDIALLSGADGVHLGTGDLPIGAARSLCGDRLLIGASTHDLAEAHAAVAAGTDYCGVGAMFPSRTKDRSPSGPAYLAAYLAEFGHVPHLAIGGITPENAGALAAEGVRGLAVSSAVCSADDPAAVCRRLIAALPATG
jgi:thiamine-phosphate pyrophosphorylase